MVITLTPREFELAAIHGAMRRCSAIERGQQHHHGLTGDAALATWNLDIEGACAEMAVAKAVNRYWDILTRPQSPDEGDVGPYQVRSTTRPGGCLLLHESDSDDAVFILAAGTAPTFNIAGWLRGREGKNPDYWRTTTGRPAFFVPQEALRPIPEGSR